MRQSSPSKRTNGFSLLEVIAGLGIMMLILGSVFAIASSAIEMGSRSNRLRVQEIRYTRVGQFFRKAFRRLPLERRIQILNGSSLSISGADNIFRWAGIPSTGRRVEIRLQGNSMEIVHFRGTVEVAAMPIMDDVTEMTWEAFDPLAQKWVSNWQDEGRKQATLIRLQYRTNQEMFCEEVFHAPVFPPTGFQIPKNQNNENNTR